MKRGFLIVLIYAAFVGLCGWVASFNAGIVDLVGRVAMFYLALDFAKWITKL